jgi:hypothetical protein
VAPCAWPHGVVLNAIATDAATAMVPSMLAHRRFWKARGSGNLRRPSGQMCGNGKPAASTAECRTKAMRLDRHVHRPSDNTLGLRRAACGPLAAAVWGNGSRGKGVGHRFARLTPGSRGVVNRGTLTEILDACGVGSAVGKVSTGRVEERWARVCVPL